MLIFYKDSFSFAERFVGNELMDFVTNYFMKKDCSVSLSKIDYYTDRSHLFFSDEQVVYVDLSAQLIKIRIGSISLFLSFNIC